MTSTTAAVVLLIEDERGDAELIRFQLREPGAEAFDVHMADSLAEARRLIDEGLQPDIVLLDLNLPDSEGPRTVERCRALTEAPIVVLTGLDDAAATQTAIVSGAEDFLTKGGEPARLRRAIDYALLRHRRDADARLTATVFRHGNEGMMIADAQGNLLDVNAAFHRITGYGRDEVIGSNPRFLQSGRHNASFYRELWQTLLSEDRWSGELYNRRKDGELIIVRLAISVVRDERGGVRHFVGFCEDVTRQKQLEQRTQASEQRFRDYAAASSDWFWEADADLRFSFFSDRAGEMLGTDPRKLLGHRREDIADPDGVTNSVKWNEHRAMLAQHLPFRNFEYLVRTDLGGRWFSISGVPCFDANGKFQGYRGTGSDISARKRAEAELLDAKMLAESASLAKSRFLAMMSHEIRTPMNSVLAFAQLLEAEELTRDQAGMVQQIRAAGQTLLHVINDILDFSKIEAGQLHVERKPFRLTTVLARVNSLLRGVAEGKGLRFDIRRSAPELGHIAGDSMRLEQVLINLVGNAIKFTAQGSVELEALILQSSNAALRLRFEVRDTGIGIAPNTVAQLFMPFTQGDAGITRRYGGTGLGLAICKHLVEEMHGEIGVQSVPRAGSTFWFEIPFERVAAEQSSLPHAPGLERRGTPSLAGLRVLAVDDNPMNQMVIARILERSGAAVTRANDGREALELLVARPREFDVVLMDVQMPVMDGLTATRAIRNNPDLATLPVIALTAGVLTEDRDEALAAGANAFLAKPIDLRQLDEALAPYLS